jgi:hypothetical protein
MLAWISACYLTADEGSEGGVTSGVAQKRDSTYLNPRAASKKECNIAAG